MAGAAMYLYRPTNAQWQNGTGSVESMSGTPYQGWVDFDRLGTQFWIIFGGNAASSGYTCTFRVRIGGTYGTVDGTVAYEQQVSPDAFAPFVARQEVTNIWTGVKVVKLTGYGQGGGDAFAQRPTLILFPVRG
jgi:hypothetical protein